MSMAIIGVAGGALALGTGIAGAVGSGGPGPAPGPRQIARKTVQLRDAYGGRNYAQDVQDALRYNALNQQLNQFSLFGTPATTLSVPYRQLGSEGRWRTLTRNVQVPESQGLFGLLGQAAPQYQQLQMANDPEGYKLLQLLTQDATGLVGQAGASPYEDRLLQQQLRGAQAARGRGYGTGDILNEVLGLDRARQGRRIAAGGYAGGVLGARQGYMGDPLMNASRLLGFGQSTMGGPVQPTNLFNPTVGSQEQAAYGANLGNYNSSVNNLTGAFSGLAQLGASGYYANRPPPASSGGGYSGYNGPIYGPGY
jgi:hypothetical protein